MIDQDKERRDRDRQDAKDFAELLSKKKTGESVFNNYIGVALTSYMNGVFDTCKCYKAAYPTA